MTSKYSAKDGKVFQDNGMGPKPLIASKSTIGEAKIYPGDAPKEGEAFATVEQVIAAAKAGGAPVPVIEGHAPSKKSEAPKG